MILEEMYNGRFYPCETVVADSPRFKQAVKASAALMDKVYPTPAAIDPAMSELCPDCRRARAAAQQNTPGMEQIHELGLTQRALRLNPNEKRHD